jgi:hypothetical protein
MVFFFFSSPLFFFFLRRASSEILFFSKIFPQQINANRSVAEVFLFVIFFVYGKDSIY